MDIKKFDFKNINYRKLGASILSDLSRLQIVLISLIVLAVLAYTLTEVAKLGDITKNEEVYQKRQAEIRATTVSFDEELIESIRVRAGDTGELEDFSGPNPFSRD